VCVTEERPAFRVAQDHPLDPDVLELGGAATTIQPVTLQEGRQMNAPDLASECARFLEVDVLCCNLYAILREFV
jgi:hypothetical protein